ncbi:hypothetical protein DFH06DRAFT_1338445 [Mycena polygramma]|nr:hypothetical protein DFH06DRAFT_1338445 [Mycena polygramma]
MSLDVAAATKSLPRHSRHSVDSRDIREILTETLQALRGFQLRVCVLAGHILRQL